MVNSQTVNSYKNDETSNHPPSKDDQPGNSKKFPTGDNSSILQRLLANQERDARERKRENEDLKKTIENSEKAMADQLTLSMNNVKSW